MIVKKNKIIMQFLTRYFYLNELFIRMLMIKASVYAAFHVCGKE